MKTLAIVVASAWTVLFPPAPAGEFELSVWGLEIQVEDVASATRAWRDAFGFAPVLSGGEVARLEKDGLTLVLVHSDAPRAPEDAAAIGLIVRRAGQDEVTALDPCESPRSSGLSIAGIGVSLEPGEGGDLLERLRLGARRPVDLVIQQRASQPRARGTRSAALLLAVERIEPAREELAKRGFEVGAPRPAPFGRRAAVPAPSGVRIELVERSPAQLAFERIASLAGSWEGKSSHGWTSRCEIEVIARGSAVLERTNFEAHPGETMLTLFHRDGERLLLTHYCVAGNQPRLAASEIEQDRLHFTFLDATNLTSRDEGHMDETVLRFTGSESFSSVWSFHRDGKTSWMEEIRYTRLAAPVRSQRGG